MSLERGEDCFTPEPGKVDSYLCKVCGSECLVERNVMGPTSYVGAMAGIKHLHDFFSCPHSKEDWHRQIRALRREQRETNSPTLKEMLEKEIAQIKETEKASEGWRPSWPDL